MRAIKNWSDPVDVEESYNMPMNTVLSTGLTFSTINHFWIRGKKSKKSSVPFAECPLNSKSKLWPTGWGQKKPRRYSKQTGVGLPSESFSD